MVASSVRALVTADTRDWVVTSRSRVVSAVTRAIRSPGSLRSTAGMRSRSRSGYQAAAGGEDHRLGGVRRST